MFYQSEKTFDPNEIVLDQNKILFDQNEIEIDPNEIGIYLNETDFYALFIGILIYVYVKRKLRNSVFNEWSHISISTFSMTQ